MPRWKILLPSILLILPALFLLLPDQNNGRPDVPPRLHGEEKPMRGPELIRHFFDDWHDPYPGDLPRAEQDRIWSEVKAVPRATNLLTEAPWQCEGPFGIFGSAGGRYSGRILDVEMRGGFIHRVAAASGGVWELDGATWRPIADQLTTQWIGSIATSPLDEDLILVGTGEPHIRAGTGLWRTTDGGDTWTNIPLPAAPSTCFRIRFQPDGQTVIGAFDLGIYRSEDAGLSWLRIPTAHWPTSLALHPTDPDILWTTVQEHGLQRSDDGGLTWHQVQGTGLPTGGNGRGAVAVCASDPDRLYVNFSNTGNHMLGVFRSDDGGATWTDITPDHDFFWGQAWYNCIIGVSPLDPDVVLAGGGGLERSVDGGATWTTTATPHVHVDHHAIEWSADGTVMALGNDGGYSITYDDGATYGSGLNKLPITQFVNIDVGNERPLVLGGGTQDNAMVITWTGGQYWYQRWGGDGGGFVVDDNNNSRFYGTAGVYGGDLPFRCAYSPNQGTSWIDFNDGIIGAGQWYTRMRAVGPTSTRLYTNSGPRVYTTPDAGQVWTQLNPTPFPAHVRELTAAPLHVHGELIFACLDSGTPGQRLRVFDGGTWHERSSGLPGGVLVRKVVPDPFQADRCFALMNGMGTPGQKVYRSDDRGVTWTNITANLPDVPLADLVVHPTLDGFFIVGTEFGCYRTLDGGASWERWNSGLPDAVVVTEMELVDLREDTGELMVAAGTYGRGFWTRPLAQTPSAAPEPGPALSGLLMRPASPNPASGETAIRFLLPEASSVRLRVLDVRGRVVADLLDGHLEAGDHAVAWRPGDLASGVYFSRLETPRGATSGRIVVLR